MRGLIIINGYPNGEKFYTQATRIAQALQAEEIETDVMKNGEVYALFTKNGSVQTNLSDKYTFAVYLDKDKYLGKMLTKAGLRLFNSADSVEICDDKMTTYLALCDSEVRMIKTIPAPLCYTPNAKPNDKFLKNVVQELNFPLVAKKSYGSFGNGVQLVQNMSELQKIETEWLYTPHMYQRYMQESCGRDIRVIVIGGKAVGGMERIAQKGEFRSNIELGGVGRSIVLTKEFSQVAEKAARHLKLDYCGVDLLETSEGAIVCEVNSNAFFEGFEKATNINVAEKYAEYISKVLNR